MLKPIAPDFKVDNFYAQRQGQFTFFLSHNHEGKYKSLKRIIVLHIVVQCMANPDSLLEVRSLKWAFDQDGQQWL